MVCNSLRPCNKRGGHRPLDLQVQTVRQGDQEQGDYMTIAAFADIVTIPGWESETTNCAACGEKAGER